MGRGDEGGEGRRGMRSLQGSVYVSESVSHPEVDLIKNKPTFLRKSCIKISLNVFAKVICPNNHVKSHLPYPLAIHKPNDFWRYLNIVEWDL